MLKTTALILIFSAIAVQAHWLVRTSCNATHPINGDSVFVENGNCMKYRGYYYLITCDPDNSVYHQALCNDEKCTDCLAPLTAPTGQCDKNGETNMCFVGVIPYEEILPSIGVYGKNYFVEVGDDPVYVSCGGRPHYSRIERPYTCITTGSLNAHSTVCNADGTFTRLEWNDKTCTSFPVKVETSHSGDCNPPAIVRGCGMNLLGRKGRSDY